jgi:hypothetical protein
MDVRRVFKSHVLLGKIFIKGRLMDPQQFHETLKETSAIKTQWEDATDSPAAC